MSHNAHVLMRKGLQVSEAAKTEKINSQSLEGLEEVFDCTGSEPGATEAGSIVADSVEPVSDVGWTLREAANNLGVSLNTVRKRLREGSLQGKKVLGVNGPEWCITPPERTSAIAPDSNAAHSTAPAITAPVHEPGSSSVISELFDELRAVRDELQAAHWRNGYLEAQLQGQKEQLKLLPDYQHKATESEILRARVLELKAELERAQGNGWARFWRWFTGRK